MADINVEFSVIDRFSETMDKFCEMVERCADSAQKMDDKVDDAVGQVDASASSAQKADKSFGGFGGSMLIVNQAMQAFSRLAEPVKQALDEIGDKERALVMFGERAGDEFNKFAADAARSLGRVEGEIRRSGMKWRNLGIGGNNIKELTMLTDRFAKFNPSRGFTDIADAFNDAVKSKNVSGLADLMGGGEGVELKLKRAGIERMLNRGDVGGAIEKFKQVADAMGYTQEKADKMGDTIDKKIERIANVGRNYITDLFADVVGAFEPVISKVLGFLESEEFESFFGQLKSDIEFVIGAAMGLIDVFIQGFQFIYHAIEPVIDVISSIATELFPFLADSSTGLVEKLVRFFVGGAVSTVTDIIELSQKMWNSVVDDAERFSNLVLDAVETVANGAIDLANNVRDRVLDIVSGLVNNILSLVKELEGTKFGDIFGINSAVENLEKVTDTIDKMKNDKYEKVKIDRNDFSAARVNVIDSAKVSNDIVESAIAKAHSFFGDSDDSLLRKLDKLGQSLSDIGDDVNKIRGMGQKEQDLRWMKEMAEQRFVNEVNLRQLTPTIQLQVKGSSNSTPRQYAKELAAELEQMAAAGTFNAYGDVG